MRMAAYTPSNTAVTTASTRCASTGPLPPRALVRRNDLVAPAPEPAAVGPCFSAVVMVGLLAEQRLCRCETSPLLTSSVAGFQRLATDRRVRFSDMSARCSSRSAAVDAVPALIMAEVAITAGPRPTGEPDGWGIPREVRSV